jgi:hypothetical protein
MTLAKRYQTVTVLVVFALLSGGAGRDIRSAIAVPPMLVVTGSIAAVAEAAAPLIAVVVIVTVIKRERKNGSSSILFITWHYLPESHLFVWICSFFLSLILSFLKEKKSK